MTSMTTTSSAAAVRATGFNAHQIKKLIESGLLAADSITGKPYAASVDRLAHLPAAAPARGDIALHLGPLQSDPSHPGVRPALGWHATKRRQLSRADEERAWRGCWNLGASAEKYIGRIAVPDVAGVVVDVALIAAVTRCPRCGLAVFEIDEAPGEAEARYRGRRLLPRAGDMTQEL